MALRVGAYSREEGFLEEEGKVSLICLLRYSAHVPGRRVQVILSGTAEAVEQLQANRQADLATVAGHALSHAFQHTAHP